MPPTSRSSGPGWSGPRSPASWRATTCRIVVVDAATDVGTGTTKANTAILHTGFDAVPGSLESRLLRRGSALLRDYAARAGIPVERTGALLVAWTAEQRRALPEIEEKARQNGYTAIRPVSAAGLYQREPHLGPGGAGRAGDPGREHHLPVDHAAGLRHRGGAGRRPARAGPPGHRRAQRGRAGTPWPPPAGPSAAAGSSTPPGWAATSIDAMLGGGGFTIRPRRGELIVFDKLARPLLGSILLPVPTAATKGVLVAPTVYGNVLLGPTAEDIGDRSDTAHHRGRAGRPARGRAPDRPGPGRRGGHRDLRRAAGRDRAPRLPDPRRSRPALRLRRRHQVNRAVGVAGDRRVRHRPAGRGGAAAGRARRGRRRPARDALHRGGGNAALPGRRADRRRPRVRADRLPLRAGHPRRDPRRAGEHRAARRRRRAAPPDQGDERPVPGLLLRRRGVGDDGGRPGPRQRRPGRRCPARPDRPQGARRPSWAGWRERQRADRRGGPGGPGRRDRAAAARGGPGPHRGPGSRGRRRPAAQRAHRLRAARPAPGHDRAGLRPALCAGRRRGGRRGAGRYHGHRLARVARPRRRHRPHRPPLARPDPPAPYPSP